MQKKKCPVCGSSDIKINEDDGFTFISCNKCKYDEAEDYDVYPEEKSGQKGKSGYTPYKRGGGRRSANKSR